MAGPPSTLRTHRSEEVEDPSTQSLHEDVSPSLQELIRLQIFTPMTLLLAIGANLVTAFAFHPTLGEVNDDYETIWSPKKELVGGYLLLMYVLEISYCLMITMVKNQATREMIVNGVGLRFCLANVLQALWSIFFMLRFFLVSEIMLLVSAFVMLTVWMTLLRYPVALRKPASWIFVHVPMRMYLLWLLNLAIWQNGLIALHWYRYTGTEEGHRQGKWEREHETHAWIAFGVITGLGLIDAFITFLGQDIAWAGCTIFLFIAILLGTDKPVQVVVPLILTSSLQIVALLAAYVWKLYDSRKQGAIRLPDDDEEEDAGHVHHGDLHRH